MNGNLEHDQAVSLQCQNLMAETGTKVYAEANKARDCIVSLQGTGWMGGAGRAAAVGQDGPFMATAHKLNAIINDLATELGVSTKDFLGMDDVHEGTLAGIGPEGAGGTNFDRMM